MTDSLFKKPLERVLIFGVSGHIGGPLAELLSNRKDGPKLRLASSSSSKLDGLKAQYPEAEAIVCSYTDQDAMMSAMKDVDAVFVVTPDFMDELACTNNLVKAAKASGTVRHIVRIMGDPPGVTMDDVPPELQRFGDGMGAAVGHQTARHILEESGLNVTYVNIAAYYMDSLSDIWHGRAIREIDTLVEVQRHYMLYVDPAEVGEACANILMRRDPKDIGTTYQLNNGHDMMDFYGVAEVLTKGLGRKIAYVEGQDLWRQYTGEDLKKKYGEMAEGYFLRYFSWEGEMIKTIFKRQLGNVGGNILIGIFNYAPRSLTDKLFVSAAGKPGGLFTYDLDKLLSRKPRSLLDWVTKNDQRFASTN